MASTEGKREKKHGDQSGTNPDTIPAMMGCYKIGPTTAGMTLIKVMKKKGLPVEEHGNEKGGPYHSPQGSRHLHLNLGV